MFALTLIYSMGRFSNLAVSNRSESLEKSTAAYRLVRGPVKLRVEIWSESNYYLYKLTNY